MKNLSSEYVDPILRLKQRGDLRKAMRRRRHSLSSSARNKAGSSLVRHVMKHPAVTKAKKIALFLSFDGEIITQPLITTLLSLDKHIYLPRIHPFNSKQLLFQRYFSHSELLPDMYGILVPHLDVTHVIPTHQLDLLFIPLVAFDKRGHRLGMGGGYYDRLLANYDDYPFVPIGLAYHWQQVDRLAQENWDIPLPEVITDKGLNQFGKNRNSPYLKRHNN